jgi:UDP-N-acetylmuramate dehydrogenase
MSLNVLQNHKLAGYTSWLIGGEADFFCTPENHEDLKEALRFAKERGIPRTILGGGSNILISDDGIPGLTICLKKFSKVESHTENGRLFVDCLAGTSKSELLKLFLKYQLSPALFLAGLPGDVGGGVVMNAGVAEQFHPREFMEIVDSIEVLTDEGEVRELTKNQLKISYRHTDGWQPHVVTRAKLSWPLNPDPTVLTQVRDANKIRLSKQPLDKPSCGSVFKNPEGHKVAQLIDSCGLKGFQIGDAQVSLKHANFIVNLGAAKAKDAWAVIQFVKQTVKERTGVDIQTEVIRLGRWG